MRESAIESACVTGSNGGIVVDAIHRGASSAYSRMLSETCWFADARAFSVSFGCFVKLCDWLDVISCRAAAHYDRGDITDARVPHRTLVSPDGFLFCETYGVTRALTSS